MTTYIITGLRTPTGRYGGALAHIRPDDLVAEVIRGVINETHIDPHTVDEVLIGNANGAGEDNRNVARMAWLAAGLPDTVPAMTVNRLCASGMSAITTGTALIESGQAHLVVAGGVESMSRAPWVMEKPKKAFSRPGEIADTSIGWRFTNPKFLARDKMTYEMPETAEEVARVCNISREESDLFAYDSHMKAAAATDAGHFTREIHSIAIDSDETIRRTTTIEKLETLRPVVAGGSVVTAGNASSLNDGASVVLLASEEAVQRYGLTPRARIVGSATAALAPEIMGLGPVPATRNLLERIGGSIDQFDAVELNEAFAAQSLACIKEMGVDPQAVNQWGGAIALGHPLGSSGCRIVITLLNRLEKNQGTRGLATMCIGIGQGQSLAIETV